ncbi:sterol esterase [Mycena floridula]|nr:sterol esterase [Mycena floridula]
MPMGAGDRDITVCEWDGCQETLGAGKVMAHVSHAHFLKTASFCKWCRKLFPQEPGMKLAKEHRCTPGEFFTLPDPDFSINNNSSSEDCLTINVWRPSVTQKKLLPVMFWIHGGAFEIGDSTDQSPLALVERSIAIGEPMMFVTANYRLSVKQALDSWAASKFKRQVSPTWDYTIQRLALEWIQQHIKAFGGDSSRVIISGASSGASSVAVHMSVNDGDTQGLFHGAFLLSGGPAQILLLSRRASRNAHDQIVREANSLCAVAQGRIADVPMIAGNDDDEGSIFALPKRILNSSIMQTFLLDGANPAQMKLVAQAYPSDPAAGSPFDTGDSNALTPQFKRIAAILGDIVFQAPRRLLLQVNSKKQNTWAYLSKRGKSTPFLGAFHTSDLLVNQIWLATDKDNVFGADALIHFINTLDPNGQGVSWPQWGASRNLLTFTDPSNISVTADTFRNEGMNLLNDIQARNREKDGIVLNFGIY